MCHKFKNITNKYYLANRILQRQFYFNDEEILITVCHNDNVSSSA